MSHRKVKKIINLATSKKEENEYTFKEVNNKSLEININKENTIFEIDKINETKKSKFSPKNKSEKIQILNKLDKKYLDYFNEEDIIPVNRKNWNNLKNLEDKESYLKKEIKIKEYDDLPIDLATRYTNTNNVYLKLQISNENIITIENKAKKY